MLEALQYEFMRNALLAAMLASVACGIIGVYVVTKKMVFISGGIAHASFGGIGLGYFLGIDPVLGVVPFSIASALTMGVISKRTKLPLDTTVGIFWALGMALGVIFISLTPGYAPDLFSYLFGSILTVPFLDIIIMLLLDGAIIIIVVSLYKEFLALSFDEEFARAVGAPAEHLYFILLCLIALAIVVLVRIVGIILVIVLLTAPAAVARQLTYNLKKMMVFSILLSALFSICGLWLSYELNLASGAVIVLVSGTGFFISLVIKRLRHSPDLHRDQR